MCRSCGYNVDYVSKTCVKFASYIQPALYLNVGFVKKPQVFQNLYQFCTQFFTQLFRIFSSVNSGLYTFYTRLIITKTI